MSNLAHPSQSDLFNAPVFQPRQRTLSMDSERFRLRLKSAMSAALTACGSPRELVAAEMGRMLGQPSLSRGMLDLYTSPSKTSHDISLLRFKALARATASPLLWDVAISDEGLMILQGDEPRLAHIALLQQKKREIMAQLKQLSSVPVDVRRG